MKRVHPAISAIAAIGLALAACVQQFGDDADSTTAPTKPGMSTPPLPTEEGRVTGEIPRDLLNEILEEAAAGRGVDPDEIEVVTAEAVTWSDGSLGCPEPGMMYTQALVPGYRVVVEAGGEQLHFHAAESGDFRFCESPKPPLEVTGTE